VDLAESNFVFHISICFTLVAYGRLKKTDFESSWVWRSNSVVGSCFDRAESKVQLWTWFISYCPICKGTTGYR
jgi:hypothetical protein